MTQITTITELDEHRARTLCAKDIEDTVISEAEDPVEFREHVEHNWRGWLPMVRAIRLSDAAAGVQSVPDDPEMQQYDVMRWCRDDGRGMDDMYRAAITASPFYTAPEGENAEA